MEKLREYIIKRWITDSYEIQKLEDFFAKPENKKNIKELKKRQVKSLVSIIIILAISLILWMNQSEDVIIFIAMIPFLILGIVAIIAPKKTLGKIMSLMERGEKSMKNKALKLEKVNNNINNSLGDLARIYYDKIAYNKWDKYAFGELDVLKKLGFINNYTSAIVKNSIVFLLEENGARALAKWYELYSSKWKIQANHCYLLKVIIPNARINIKKDINIVSLLNIDNKKNKKLSYYIGYLTTWLLYAYAFFQYFRIIELILSLNYLFSVPLLIVLHIFIIASIVLINNFSKRRNARNKIDLENIDFEKMYNVYSEDQIESRMIVNPAFMEKITSLTRKTKRKYDFLFRDNYFYIKWYLDKNYLSIYNINNLSNIVKNEKVFIDWYIDIKEVISFVKDMEILYLSKIK